MIRIKTDFKTHGKDTTLWYYHQQGETFSLVMDTKKGYLVRREDIEDSRMYLVKHKHANLITEEQPDNEIV